ncbi:MAG TPA: universal stress protein [Solirubrobacteraceae bacterium]|nr:universal stress protein [Solirubrobacteraceae bacterium]
MTMVAGHAPDGRGRAVLHLAGMLARSTGDDLVLCAVVPRRWPPGPARVDAEYQAELRRVAQDTLEKARARLSADLAVTLVVHDARSAPAGLLEVAEQHDASVIVAGSAAHGGVGQVSVGSTTSRLLHSSPIPVALAPRGFRCRPDARVTRATAAFSGSDDDLVIAAASVAARVGVALRIASFAVHEHAPYTAGVGTEADDSMVAEWTRDIEAAARRTLDEVSHLSEVPAALETVVGRGPNWDDALEDVEWDDGDILVVGSSSVGPIARVFLGSRATKIVRHSPVPVIVVPRGVVAELAGEAVHAESGRA